jgi:hypothetical protein
VTSKIKDKGKISDLEFSILTSMVLNKFDKPLKFNEVRNVVKKIIWKLAMEDLGQLRSIFYDATKQVMFYYKFGSSLNGKKSNYFLSMKAETIFELFLRENFPSNCNSMYSLGIDWIIIKRYRIKNIFWNKDAVSETSELRKNYWDELLKLRTNLILKSRKSQTLFKVQILEK